MNSTPPGRHRTVPGEQEAHPMTHQPQLRERAAQPYAGIRTSVTMDGLPAAVDEAFPELFGWLGGRGIEVAGPPFIRYHVIDMQGELEIELGVPAGVTDVDGGRIRPGVLPGGRYVVPRHGLAQPGRALPHEPGDRARPREVGGRHRVSDRRHLRRCYCGPMYRVPTAKSAK